MAPEPWPVRVGRKGRSANRYDAIGVSITVTVTVTTFPAASCFWAVIDQVVGHFDVDNLSGKLANQGQGGVLLPQKRHLRRRRIVRTD